MKRTALTYYRPRALLVLLGSAVLAVGLLALVGPKPAWGAEPTFEPAPNSPFTVGSTPTTVTNADFNGDGKMDLAAQNSGSNSVSVLLGNGDGTFKTKQDFAVGAGPSSVTSADLDGDDKADLAVANWSSSSVSVLLGNGDGTFDPKTDFTVGGSPSSVISADFNGDTFADLAVANYASSSVSVLLGQDSNSDGKGDGTFRPKTDFLVYQRTCNDFLCIDNTAGPNQVIAADFNGDAKDDLATANIGSCIFLCAPGGVSVLLGNGNGTFQAAKLAWSGDNGSNNASITSIAVYGSSNLAATDYNFGRVYLLMNTGNGTFSNGGGFSVGSNPSAVTSADLDGDSKADLAVSNFTSDNVSVLWGSGGSFQAAQNFAAGDGPIFIIGAGLNADSFADLAVANQNSNNVSVLLNTPPPPDTTPPTVSLTAPASGTTVRGTTTFSASASDDVGVTKVEFLVDGQVVGTDTTAPYSTSWNSATVPDGDRTIQAKAYDAANNEMVSSSVNVTVDNTAPDTTPPTVDEASLNPSKLQTGVQRNTDITATFSEEMNPDTLSTSTVKLSVYNKKKRKYVRVTNTAVSCDSPPAPCETVTLDPYGKSSELLGANKKYKVTITTGVKDKANNPLAQNKVWTFRTGSS